MASLIVCGATVSRTGKLMHLITAKLPSNLTAHTKKWLVSSVTRKLRLTKKYLFNINLKISDAKPAIDFVAFAHAVGALGTITTW
jgi:hypothetical protein